MGVTLIGDGVFDFWSATRGGKCQFEGGIKGLLLVAILIL